MLITIDKTKELTRKEYIDFLQKTKGDTLTEARISQLVSTGKLKVRDYPQLGNLQLIILDDDEQALSQSFFTTSQPLHTYSYKELGQMFGKLIHDQNNEVGNAKTLLTEKQDELEKLGITLQQVELERNQARQTNEELNQFLSQQQIENQRLQTELIQRQEQIDRLITEAAQHQEVIEDLQQKLELERSFRREFDEFKQLIMGMLETKKGAEQKKPVKRKSPKNE